MYVYIVTKSTTYIYGGFKMLLWNIRYTDALINITTSNKLTFEYNMSNIVKDYFWCGYDSPLDFETSGFIYVGF
jgi:hypothetical protein